MRRSTILDGKQQQRSRAKLRGRLDRGGFSKEGEPPVTTEQLNEYLGKEYPDGLSVAEIEQLDLKGFLTNTAEIAQTSALRLRQLAIHIESSAYSSQQLRGWLALRRIYDLADRSAESKDERWEVVRSKAISAHCLVPSAHDDDGPKQIAARKRVLNDAYKAALRLKDLGPDYSGSYSLLGQIRFDDPDGDLEEALRDTDRALSIRSDNDWALWHRASILRNLRRWKEAVEAYNTLDPAFFTGHRAARYEWGLESRAYCRLCSGDRDGAVEEFEALLGRYEKNPHLAKEADWCDIVSAATGRLRPELGRRAKALVARYADWLLGDFENQGSDDADDSIDGESDA